MPNHLAGTPYSGDNRPDYEVNANDRVRAVGFADALDQVDLQITELDDSLARLYNKLDPMLVPMPNMAQDPGDTMPAVSPVAERLYRQVYKLQEMVRVAQTLRERIDL